MLYALSLALLILLLFVGLSVASRFVQQSGLSDGKLRPCPDTPNCVCSEFPGEHFISPILIAPLSPEQAMQRMTHAIRASGGRIEAQKTDYVHATFTTSIMRYVDDVELRLDSKHGLLHLRSASRVGHSDLGANRHRLEQIITRYAATTH